MTSDFPGRPKLLKGALAVYPSQTPGVTPQVIVFQYNADQLSRTLEKRAPEEKKGNVGAAKEDVLRAQGPPIENIKLTIELDATDQLAEPSPNSPVADHGLYPVLATLEMLLYPSTARILENQALASAGKVQVNPADLPLSLLIWGKSRVVPVLLTNFSVTEEAFDQALNPIRAKVELGMKVLTYMELKQKSIGRDIYFAYQRQKETLTQQFQPGEDSSIRGLLPL